MCYFSISVRARVAEFREIAKNHLRIGYNKKGTNACMSVLYVFVCVGHSVFRKEHPLIHTHT